MGSGEERAVDVVLWARIAEGLARRARRSTVLKKEILSVDIVERGR